MENTYRFFENKKCEYYPCHKEVDAINCLFCFCPLYSYEKCPGTPHYIENGGKTIKDCSACVFPHERDNYEKIMRVLAGKSE